MGRVNASLVVLVLAAAALGLLACGSSEDADLLPGETASEINSNIDAVERLVSERDCVGAEGAAATITGQVESLQGVDAKLKRALSEGAVRLNEVVAECEEESPEETVETFEPSEAEREAEEQEEREQEKPDKEKPEKETSKEPEEENEGPTLPPQSEGKGEEKGGGPSEEAEPPSGGVGPGVEAGEG